MQKFDGDLEDYSNWPNEQCLRDKVKEENTKPEAPNALAHNKAEPHARLQAQALAEGAGRDEK